MNQRITPEVLDYMVKAYSPPSKTYDDSVTGRLALDLKDARAEIDRLNHKVELLQGPGEGAI